MSAVTQWFDIKGQPPPRSQRGKWFEVRKGRLLWLARWDGIRFNRFELRAGQNIKSDSTLLNSMFAPAKQWRGLADNPELTK